MGSNVFEVGDAEGDALGLLVGDTTGPGEVVGA